jgi:hypothetical protein
MRFYFVVLYPEGQLFLIFVPPQSTFPNDGIRYQEADSRYSIPAGSSTRVSHPPLHLPFYFGRFLSFYAPYLSSLNTLLFPQTKPNQTLTLLFPPPPQELEITETKYGFIPSSPATGFTSPDSTAWRVRRRYRLTKGGHPQLVLVHYSRGVGARGCFFFPRFWFLGFFLGGWMRLLSARLKAYS